jgi:peptide/nickel transport system permease protein
MPHDSSGFHAGRLLVRRLLVAALLVFVVSSASLVLARLAPGDFATASLGPSASADLVARTRARYGLERSVARQYTSWLSHAVRWDFGRSMAYDRPVADLVPERAANTALLALAALLVATLVGLPLGVVTGSRPSGPLASSVRAVSVVLLSMPPLLTSLLLVFLAARTGWLPVGGMASGDPGAFRAADLARHMIVPVAALALPIAALFERLQSQALHEVTAERFVLAARARGIPWRRIVWRDALRAALIPVLSIYGIVIGSLLSGSFAVEMVSAWPGLGRLMLDALRARDVYLVAGCAAAGSLFLAVGTLAGDLALAVVDPRARE